MNRAALRPDNSGAIDYTALLKAELTVLWMRGRRSILTYVVVLYGLLILTAASIIADMRADPERVQDTFSFSGMDVLLVPIMLGVLWALWTWRGEAPSQRGYFYSAPTDRTTRNLVRTVAGWIWLMLSVALYAVGCAIAAVSVYGIDAITRGPLIVWPALFISATVVYLLVTPFAMLAEHPDRAIAGAFLGVMFVPLIFSMAELTQVQEIYSSIVLHLGTSLNPHARLSGWATDASYGAAVVTWLVLATLAVFLSARRFRDSR